MMRLHSLRPKKSRGYKAACSAHCFHATQRGLCTSRLLLCAKRKRRGLLAAARRCARTFKHRCAWMPRQRQHEGGRTTGVASSRAVYPAGSRSRGDQVVAVTVIFKPDSAARHAQHVMRPGRVAGSKRAASRTRAEPVLPSKKRRVIRTSSFKVTAKPTARSVASTRHSRRDKSASSVTKRVDSDGGPGPIMAASQKSLMCDEVSPPSFSSDMNICSPALAMEMEPEPGSFQKQQASTNEAPYLEIEQMPTAEVRAQAVCVFLDLANASKLFPILKRVSIFFDGYCLAAVIELMRRGGCLSFSSPTACFDERLAIAFMLTLKMDEEAMDRCIEKALWNLLASSIFFDHVPSCSGARELETYYFAANKQLDLKRASLRATELDFLRKIDWRCHVGLSDRILIVSMLPDALTKQHKRVNILADRQTSGKMYETGLEELDETMLFLPDKNDEGERTWGLLSDILCLMFDTRLLLPRERKKANRQPVRKKRVASLPARQSQPESGLDIDSCIHHTLVADNELVQLPSDYIAQPQHCMRRPLDLPNLLDDTTSPSSPSSFLAHMANATPAPARDQTPTMTLASSQYELALSTKGAPHRSAPKSSTLPREVIRFVHLDTSTCAGSRRAGASNDSNALPRIPSVPDTGADALD